MKMMLALRGIARGALLGKTKGCADAESSSVTASKIIMRQNWFKQIRFM